MTDNTQKMPGHFKRVVIIGVNEEGKRLKYYTDRSKIHRLIYFCDETGQTKGFYAGVEVITLDYLAELYHVGAIENIIIAKPVSAWRAILRALHGLGIAKCYVTNLFFDQAAAVKSGLAEELIAADTSRPDLFYLETHVADNCNLNCKGCAHYSNLVTRPAFASLDQYRKDLNRLQELYWNISQIRLTGGEPLLNPQLADFIKAARQAFPAANLAVVTNGLLITKQAELLFQTMRDYRCAFHISPYRPIYEIRDELEFFLAKREIVWEFTSEETALPIARFHKDLALDEFYSGDPTESWTKKNCQGSRRCAFLRDGWLYPCGSFILSNIFEEYYSVKLNRLNEEERQKLRVNLHQTALNGFLINEILEGPHEACRYCDPGKKSQWYPWSVRGTKDVPMEDWLISR